MPDSRIFDLDPVTAPAGYEFAVDKEGAIKAKSLSIDNLAAYVFAKYFQLKSVAVVKGVNTIPVTGQATAGYLLLCNMQDSDGGGSYKTFNQTATSFQVKVSAAGTFTYLIKNT